MGQAEEAWGGYSDAQKREVLTACVMVALGPYIKEQIPHLVEVIHSAVRPEIAKLKAKEERTRDEDAALKLMQEVENVPQSADGIERLEQAYKRIKVSTIMMHIGLPILQKLNSSIPSELRFDGFAELIRQNAASKMVRFAQGWSYSGKGYEPPKGISAPFSGYDSIINALMGHPRCKAEMQKQTKLWEKAQAQKK